jgi:hypothetical protein
MCVAAKLMRNVRGVSGMKRCGFVFTGIKDARSLTIRVTRSTRLTAWQLAATTQLAPGSPANQRSHAAAKAPPDPFAKREVYNDTLSDLVLIKLLCDRLAQEMPGTQHFLT